MRNALSALHLVTAHPATAEGCSDPLQAAVHQAAVLCPTAIATCHLPCPAGVHDNCKILIEDALILEELKWKNRTYQLSKKTYLGMNTMSLTMLYVPRNDQNTL